MENQHFTVRRAVALITILFVAAVMFTQLYTLPEIDRLTLEESLKLDAARLEAIDPVSAQIVLDTLQAVEQARKLEIELETVNIR